MSIDYLELFIDAIGNLKCQTQITPLKFSLRNRILAG